MHDESIMDTDDEGDISSKYNQVPHQTSNIAKSKVSKHSLGDRLDSSAATDYHHDSAEINSIYIKAHLNDTTDHKGELLGA